MPNNNYLSLTELEASMDLIRQSPKDHGVLKMIVRRPGVDEREVIHEGELNTEDGLIGDTWKTRHTPTRSPDPEAQITIMNSRTIALLAQEEERWPLAGDQFYVDMDLSNDNLPPGTRLELGTAVIEVTAEPHTGCGKFAQRYGTDATKFVNSPEGKRLHLRGINARVVRGGVIRVGDIVRKI